jgi:hypothetical protein
MPVPGRSGVAAPFVSNDVVVPGRPRFVAHAI